MNGYRVRMLSVFHSIGQMKNLYGTAWENFMTSAGIHQFFTPNEMETAKYISEKMGQRTIIVESTSTSPTNEGPRTVVNRSPQPVPAMRPDEVMSTPKWATFVFFSGSVCPVPTHNFPYYQDEIFKGRYGANPFHEDAPPYVKVIRGIVNPFSGEYLLNPDGSLQDAYEEYVRADELEPRTLN
jgi:type IV secretion system protein VirD4